MFHINKSELSFSHVGHKLGNIEGKLHYTEDLLNELHTLEFWSADFDVKLKMPFFYIRINWFFKVYNFNTER